MNRTLKTLLTTAMFTASPLFAAAEDVAFDMNAAETIYSATRAYLVGDVQRAIDIFSDIGRSDQASIEDRLHCAHFLLGVGGIGGEVRVFGSDDPVGAAVSFGQTGHEEAMVEEAIEIFSSIDNDPAVAQSARDEARIYLAGLDRKESAATIYSNVGNDVTKPFEMRRKAAEALKNLGQAAEAAAILEALPAHAE